MALPGVVESVQKPGGFSKVAPAVSKHRQVVRSLAQPEKDGAILEDDTGTETNDEPEPEEAASTGATDETKEPAS